MKINKKLVLIGLFAAIGLIVPGQSNAMDVAETCENIKAAIKSNSTTKLDTLISKKNVNAKDTNGWTALHYAAEEGNLDIVKYLIEKGANIKAENNVHQTVLHIASGSDALDIVQYLIEKKGLKIGGQCIEGKDTNGWTALHHVVAKYRNFEMAKRIITYLVEKGANIDTKDFNGCTVLHYAIIKGSLAMVKYLIEEKGANVFEQAKLWKTAIHYAAQSGKLKIVKYLVEKGLKIDETDRIGCTALHYAAQSGKLNVVKYLIETKKININKKNNLGWTALHYAVQYATENGNLEVLKYLVEKGAEIVAVNKNGLTVLHHAAWLGKFEVVKYFVETLGMSPYVKTGYLGQTPLDLAKKAKRNAEKIKNAEEIKKAGDVAEYLSQIAPLRPYQRAGWLNDLTVVALGAITRLGLRKTSNLNKWWCTGLAAAAVGTHLLEEVCKRNFPIVHILKTNGSKKA